MHFYYAELIFISVHVTTGPSQINIYSYHLFLPLSDFEAASTRHNASSTEPTQRKSSTKVPTAQLPFAVDVLITTDIITHTCAVLQRTPIAPIKCHQVKLCRT